jgi:hypothetical protein
MKTVREPNGTGKFAVEQPCKHLNPNTATGVLAPQFGPCAVITDKFMRRGVS